MEETKKRNLTKKEIDFCINYLETGNATQSALKAGLTKNYNSAKKLGFDKLQVKEIGDFITYLRRETIDKAKTNYVEEFYRNLEEIVIRLQDVNNLNNQDLERLFRLFCDKVGIDNKETSIHQLIYSKNNDFNSQSNEQIDKELEILKNTLKDLM